MLTFLNNSLNSTHLLIKWQDPLKNGFAKSIKLVQGTLFQEGIPKTGPTIEKVTAEHTLVWEGTWNNASYVDLKVMCINIQKEAALLIL